MREIEYKAVAGRTLRLHISPPAGSAPEPAPAAVFFHGGGWLKGDWTQFGPQALRLNEIGLLTVLVEYRLQGPVPATEDAIDAMAAVFENAADLGVDGERIIAIGGSAGGQLALATALLDPPDRRPVARPAALALLNPVTDTTGEFPAGLGRHHFEDDTQARKYSPLHHITDRMPPVLILHGTADTAVHPQNSVAFADAVEAHGGRCELVLYPGQKHGFFNPRNSGFQRPDVDDDHCFEQTTAEIIQFIRTTIGR